MPNESNNDWFKEAACLDFDPELFFDKYEEDETIRESIDGLCADCPIARLCFAVGVSGKEYGIWGGVYLEKGKVSREYNSHKDKEAWAETWEYLTTDKEN